jgi:hypothetical protein
MGRSRGAWFNLLLTKGSGAKPSGSRSFHLKAPI